MALFAHFLDRFISIDRLAHCGGRSNRNTPSSKFSLYCRGRRSWPRYVGAALQPSGDTNRVMQTPADDCSTPRARIVDRVRIYTIKRCT